MEEIEKADAVKKTVKLTEYGKELRRIRLDKNIRLGDMAEAVGVTAAYLSGIENGHKDIPDTLTDKIVEVYGLDSDEAIRLKKLEMENSDSDYLRVSLPKELTGEQRDTLLLFYYEFARLGQRDLASINDILINGGGYDSNRTIPPRGSSLQKTEPRRHKGVAGRL